MTNLYLIRHGQADGLKPGINGTVIPNAGLSPTGVRQAELLRDRLANTEDIHADVLLSSPLRRAKETAQIIAPVLRVSVTIAFEGYGRAGPQWFLENFNDDQHLENEKYISM